MVTKARTRRITAFLLIHFSDSEILRVLQNIPEVQLDCELTKKERFIQKLFSKMIKVIATIFSKKMFLQVMTTLIAILSSISSFFD